MAGPFDNLSGESYEPGGSMSPVSERVFQLQSQVASTRTQPIDPNLAALLQTVGNELNVYFEVTSGGQPAKGSGGKRTGSVRHDEGKAADLKAYTMEGGQKRYLDHTNSTDQKLWSEIVRLSVAGGATGIGAGKDYMGGQTVHIGYGGKGTWGAGGRGANAPEWLREAYKSGTLTPPLSIPQVASLTDTASALAPVPQRKSAALDAITSATGGRVASPGIPSAYDSPKTPQQVASLYNGIYPAKQPSAQLPKLFGDTVGTPDTMIPPTDTTYTGANRMSVGGVGSLLGGRSIPPAMPNPGGAVPSTFPARPGVIPQLPRQAVASGVGGANIAGQAQMPRNVVPASVQRDMAAINAIPPPLRTAAAPTQAQMQAIRAVPQAAKPAVPSVPAPIPATMSAGLAAQRPNTQQVVYIEGVPFAKDPQRGLVPLGGRMNAPTPASAAQAFLARNAPQPAPYSQMQQARNRVPAPMPASRRGPMLFAPVPATRQAARQVAAPVPQSHPQRLYIVNSGGGGEDFNNQGSGFYSLSSSV